MNHEPIHALLVVKVRIDPVGAMAAKEITTTLESSTRYLKVADDTYVVQPRGPTGYHDLVVKLDAVAIKYSTHVRYIMSPPLIGGEYAGLLERDMWPLIRTLQGRTG
jgi:hypothetical protein